MQGKTIGPAVEKTVCLNDHFYKSYLYYDLAVKNPIMSRLIFTWRSNHDIGSNLPSFCNLML
jgi:hypothetical protein